ncbi:AraC family transcriptional regulator [Puniceicoccus vermicola]|uniref:AraC family transcriptional regulator n=1 Tax=Puniceicoccus vermicola TaxID=388746 RepID=A0A7X1AW01_9BACT|nr:AraC family transcriptional regulator [Puniceicoccus vermicola]MBC2600804.1 AraC family transcriptional regulator [Puniceicoccus vermicola]
MNHIKNQEDHAAHTHNFLEIAFLLGGSTRHRTIRGENLCRAGKVIVVPPGAWHAYSECDQLEIVNCLLSPRMLARELAWLRNEPGFSFLFETPENGLAQEVRIFDLHGGGLERVKEGLGRLEEAYVGGSSSVSVTGWVLLVLEILRDSAKTPDEKGKELARRHPAVSRGLQLLATRMGEDWSLDQLAEELNLNPSYLVRLFQKEIGHSPMKLLAAVRAEEAANLLLGTDARVGEIGERVGWSDPKRFAENFRRHFGMKASEYRKRMLGVFEE